MKDVRLEALKDEIYEQIFAALKGNNIESAARLADVYATLSVAGNQVAPVVGFGV